MSSVKFIEIELLSNAIFNNTGSLGLIDSDCIYDENGLFYIPSKRIKGALRESAIEVLEMQNIDDKSIELQINELFGTPKNEAKLELFDAYLKDKEFYQILSKDFGKNRVLELNSIILNQTAIDKNGVAKDGSLRKIRAIKKGLIFNMKVILKDERFSELLKLAFMNLRRIGTMRNRGLGEVECRIKDFDEKSLEDTRQTDKAIEITLKSPVALTLKKGDNFNVQSYDYIPATTLKGAIANSLKGDLKDEFLKNAYVKNAYIVNGGKVFKPTPKNLQIYKYKDDNKVFDSFDGVENKDDNKSDDKKKNLGKFFALSGSEILTYEPKKESFFHIKRVREKQSSDEKDGAIFVYDALSKDQVFAADIVCNDELLKKVKDSLNKNIRFGRSKNQSYSNAEIFINLNYKKEKSLNLKEFYMVCESPLVLLNDSGVIDLSIENLKNYLKNLGFEVEKIKANTRFSRHKFFKLSYGCKVNETLAFEVGSVFKITLNKEKDSSILDKGLGEFMEFGYGQVEIYKSFENLKFAKFEEKPKELNLELKNIPNEQKNILFKIFSEIIYDEILLDKGYFDKELTYPGENLTLSEFSRLESILKNAEKKKDFEDKFVEKKSNDELTTFNKKISEKCPKFEFFNLKKLNVIPKKYQIFYDELLEKEGFNIVKRALITKIRYHKKLIQKESKWVQELSKNLSSKLF